MKTEGEIETRQEAGVNAILRTCIHGTERVAIRNCFGCILNEVRAHRSCIHVSKSYIFCHFASCERYGL